MLEYEPLQTVISLNHGYGNFTHLRRLDQYMSTIFHFGCTIVLIMPTVSGSIAIDFYIDLCANRRLFKKVIINLSCDLLIL
jgi:hypothetical protein